MCLFDVAHTIGWQTRTDYARVEHRGRRTISPRSDESLCSVKVPSDRDQLLCQSYWAISGRLAKEYKSTFPNMGESGVQNPTTRIIR